MTLARGCFLRTASAILALAFTGYGFSEEEIKPVEPPKTEAAPKAEAVEPKPEEPKAETPAAPVAPIEVKEPAPAAEAPKAEPTPAPAPAPAVRAADAQVVIDGVSYSWEEAVRKFPEMRSKAPANMVFDPNYKPSGKSEPAIVTESPSKQEEPKPEKKKKTKKVKKGDESQVLQPVVEPTPEHSAQALLEKARERIVLEEKLRKNVRRLTTPSWKDAQKELVDAGSDAMPFLVDALGVSDEPQDGEYPLETYTLISAGRPTYSRPLKDVAFEVLDNMVRNHSNWKGAVPGRDQKAWQEFWSANSASIAFGR